VVGEIHAIGLADRREVRPTRRCLAHTISIGERLLAYLSRLASIARSIFVAMLDADIIRSLACAKRFVHEECS
jgi:hypothetical protein